MDRDKLAILLDCFPRSFILGLIAIPATYMLGDILPVNSFLVVWGSMFGLAFAPQIVNIVDVIKDVRALIMERLPEPNLALTARIALRRTWSPAVMMLAMLAWVLHSSYINELIGLRNTSEWLLYYLITMLGINAWFDVFDRHKMLSHRQLQLQGEEDGAVRS